MKNKKLLSTLLAIVMLLNWIVPFQMSAVSNGVPEEYSEPGVNEGSYPASFIEAKDPDELQNELDELTCEIISLREENIKHIKLPDGSFQAVVYGNPVHRLSSDGNWEEIDNTLTEKDGMVKTNDSRFSFEKHLPDTGHIYQILDGNYSISVSFPDAKEGIVAIIDNPDPDIGGKTKLERLTEVETLSSSVTYSNVLPGIDLRYTLVSNDTKEDIIVKEPCESYSYSFEIATDGLSVRCENGKIIFGDILTSKDVYYIPVPLMYDDTGEVSYEVFYSLEELQHGVYRLTITADEKWINSTERRFPVIIDPSLTDIGQIDDTFVASVTSGMNYGGTHELTVANNMEVYYKFDTPHLPTGVTVQNATFRVPYYFTVYSSDYMTVDLYKITSNWDEDTVTWSTKPTVSTCIDTKNIYRNGATTNNPQYTEFSVKNYVQSWYTGTSNYGFAMKHGGGNVVSVSFVAKERMTIFAQLVIEYSGNKLPEGIYTIQKQGSNCYFESYRPATLAWVLQDTTFTSSPLTTDHLENLFKLAYRPANDDYVIRSMIDSSLVIYPSVYNSAPIAGFRTESDSSMPAGYTWKIEKTGDYYYITYTQNGVKYYIRSNSTNNGYKLVLTTNPNDSGTKWIFNSYTGNTYEDIEMENYVSSIYVGDTVPYKSFMRSTRIGHNGPVSYSVTNADSGNTSTDKAEINSSTGDLLAKKPGSIRVKVSYPGAPWVWIWNVTVLILPVSGYEIQYSPADWNNTGALLNSNCYNYALNKRCLTNTDPFALMQPGMATNAPVYDPLQNGYHNGAPCWYAQIKTENDIVSNATSDADEWFISFIPINKNDVCPNGTYKIALVLDLIDDSTVENRFHEFFSPYHYYLEDPDTDYHWYRQNPDGTWSHKTGQGTAKNTDALGETIYDPQLCNRDYTSSSGINYEIFVGYFAVSPLG